MKRIKNIRMLRIGILGVAAILVSGCSFDVSIPVFKDQVLQVPPSVANPQGGSAQMADSAKITLGPFPFPEICGFQSLEEIRENLIGLAEENAVDFPVQWLGRIKIDAVILTAVEFLATTGAFNTIKRVVMDLGFDGENSGRFEAAAPEGFGTSVMLVSETPVDLIKNSEGSCLKPSLTLEGSMPTSDVIYDLVMHLTIKYHVGLF